MHLHTWYTHFGGILAKLNYGIPMVLTVHSLEPLRPWKREQLGGGYDFSVWVEKTAIEMADAVIAVSQETKVDMLRFFDVDPKKIHVIHNGIDLDEYHKVDAPDVLREARRRSRQALRALRRPHHPAEGHHPPRARHPAPRSRLPGRALRRRARHPGDRRRNEARRGRRPGQARTASSGSRPCCPCQEKIALYSHADVFCCPSIYEPFGIINLEAMACETAVVASAVGGIKEVVLPGETGILVPLLQQAESPYEALHPEQYARDLAEAVNKLMADRSLRDRMAKAGRERAVDHFSWRAIAEKTFELYQTLL